MLYMYLSILVVIVLISSYSYNFFYGIVFKKLVGDWGLGLVIIYKEYLFSFIGFSLDLFFKDFIVCRRSVISC